MAARLEEIARTVDPLQVRFLAADQVEIYRKMFRDQPERMQDLSLRYRYANTLLNAGQNLESLREYQAIEAQLGEAPTNSAVGNLRNVWLDQALTYLREAERLNCLSNHNADSCLLPLQGGGVHRWTEPSHKAFDQLTRTLNRFPDDLAARWLLNVTAMTLGEYPAKVPQRWLIPPSAFASDIPFPRFREIAPAVGLAVNELSGGSVTEDFDGDGFLDVMVTSIGLRDPMRYFRNRSDGTFVEQSREAGLTGLTGGLNMVTADYDNDGDVDVLVLRGAWMREEGRHPNSLLQNNGKGVFQDVTEAAGMLSLHPTQTAAWFDFDGDGWLDVFIGNESVPGQSRHSSELFRNQGNGTFTNVARLSGVTLGAYVKGVSAGDFNNDGRPDLYVSVLGGRNRLLRNDGPKPGSPDNSANNGWVFTDVARAAGVEEPIDSFPCWFFDYDNDGWLDLFVAGYKFVDVGDIAADVLGLPTRGTKARLYRNRGDGTFANVSAEMRLDRVLHAMGSNFGDLDNDGWLDFYLGTGDPDFLTLIPNRMFRNDAGRKFQDVTTAGGFGHLQKGHGVSFADLDNDGDQDVFEDMGGAVSGDVYPNVLFENPGFGNAWISLKLEGTRANRAGIGARVRLDFEDDGKSRSVHRVLGSGGSFGANPLRLEIGLGKAAVVKTLTIQWPGGGPIQTLTQLPVRTRYLVRQDATQAQVLRLKSFAFPTASGHAHHH